MAVRAALRVELALRAGDIPRAVHGTVAFFEAALWSNTDTFLSQPLVQAVLKELDEASPENLLNSLLAEVRRRLVAYRDLQAAAASLKRSTRASVIARAGG